MTARGCQQVYQSVTVAAFEVWSDSYPGLYMYQLYTFVEGLDTCNGGASWAVDMSTQHYDGIEVNYGTSGAPVLGSYNNCFQGGSHVYRVMTSNYAKWSSASQWEGSSGFVNF